MKEIKFRGKRHDNGEWICGNLIDWGNHEQLVIFPLLEYASSLPLETIIAMKAKSVDYKTVGQYTGVMDKFGKEIFDGDFIRLTPLDYPKLVAWNEEQCRWDMYIDNFPVSGFNKQSLKNYEVIGNIYDNPELLKVGY